MTFRGSKKVFLVFGFLHYINLAKFLEKLSKHPSKVVKSSWSKGFFLFFGFLHYINLANVCVCVRNTFNAVIDDSAKGTIISSPPQELE